MLYITTNWRLGSSTEVHTKSIQWHVGDPNPLAFNDLSNVVGVQADDKELEHILRHSNGLPSLHLNETNLMRWFGDDAKFIAGNLLRHFPHWSNT